MSKLKEVLVIRSHTLEREPIISLQILKKYVKNDTLLGKIASGDVLDAARKNPGLD